MLIFYGVFIFGKVRELKRIIQKHYLSSFYVTTFIFVLLLLPLHFVFQSVGNYSVSFTQLSPALAVVFIALISKDKTVLYKIKSHFYFHSSKAKWIIPAIAFPAICIIASSALMSLFKLPFSSWNGNILFYILNISAMLVGCIGEEIGWRGFLLPQLQERHSPFISSIIAGVLWGVWHLNFTGGILGFVLYTITIIEMSILMTWLFNKTKGNLFLMILWHFIFNLSSHVFLWERFNVYLFLIESIIFGTACVVIVISNSKEFFKKCLPTK